MALAQVPESRKGRGSQLFANGLFSNCVSPLKYYRRHAWGGQSCSARGQVGNVWSSAGCMACQNFSTPPCHRMGVAAGQWARFGHGPCASIPCPTAISAQQTKNSQNGHGTYWPSSGAPGPSLSAGVPFPEHHTLTGVCPHHHPVFLRREVRGEGPSMATLGQPGRSLDEI